MMKFTLQTLTPLYTGGIETGRMDRIHETGLIGSLRWWYEAVLRGLVGTDQICNPIGESGQRCNREQQQRVCLACDLFGATGWKRRFRLEIAGGEKLFERTPQIRVKAPSGNNGWFFNSPYIATAQHPIEVRLRVLRERSETELQLRPSKVLNDLQVITSLISRWGGLGAKTQHGFGVANFQFGNGSAHDIVSFLQGLTQGADEETELASLSDMFFAKLVLVSGTKDDWWKNANLDEKASHRKEEYRGVRDKADEWGFGRKRPFYCVPIAPAIKHKLRFRAGSYLPEAHKNLDYVFGNKEEPSKSRLHISNAYKNADGEWEFRVWGWIPKKNKRNDILRDQLLAELHQLVTANQVFWREVFNADIVDFSRTVWREKDASNHGRNSKDAAGNAVAPATTANFLKCLLA